MKPVAVILSGCGVFDGSEIQETVLTLLALEKLGLSYQCIAPNIEQHHVVNHITGQVMVGEKRQVLLESARVCRGNIIPLNAAKTKNYSALVIPGGFGVAKNLSDFASLGDECTVNQELKTFCEEFLQGNKPMGFICIAPAITPKLLGEGVSVTIGSDQEVITKINAMGGKHKQAKATEVVFDEKYNILSTPGYMLSGSILELNKGITALVSELKKLIIS